MSLTYNPVPRYTLNLKGIPFKTEWVEFPNIELLCKKLGIPPTCKREDRSDRFTLPAIHSPSTGVYISDSILIAEYLEKTYLDTPQIFPHNTFALQAAFTAAFVNNLSALWNFIVHATYAILTPRSQEYYRHTREKSFGKVLEDIAPKGECKGNPPYPFTCLHLISFIFTFHIDLPFVYPLYFI